MYELYVEHCKLIDEPHCITKKLCILRFFTEEFNIAFRKRKTYICAVVKKKKKTVKYAPKGFYEGIVLFIKSEF